MSYLWLKYVTGVNLSVHCAQCLKGHYSKLVSAKIKRVSYAALSEHEAKAYYLCGVAKPYRWANNFHLAFVYAPDSMIRVNRCGVKVQIANAREIKIHEVDPSSPKADRREYASCRNWQFAHMMAKGELSGTTTDQD